MDWIKLVIGAIVVIAWIVNNIREQQKAKVPAPPPLPPADDASDPAPRKIDDLQDFLSEMRRRRKDPTTSEEPLPAKLADSPRPVPLPPLPVPAMPIPAPAPPAFPSPAASASSEPPRNVRRKKSPPPPPPPPSFKPVQTKSVPAADTSSVPHPPHLAPTRHPGSATVREALALLKSPHGAAAAVLIREILAPPMSRRRGSTPRAKSAPSE